MEDSIKRDWTFVFLGTGAEYVLNPLFEHMAKKGFDCVEIDCLTTDPIPVFESVLERKTQIALVSSQHFYHSRYNRTLFGSDRHVSLMEAAANLLPGFICFCPHDLMRPVVAEEIPYLASVDLYLAAEERELILSQYCDVELVGWMKAKAPISTKSYEFRNGAIWLISGASTFCQFMGMDTVIDLISELAADRCSVKIASWFNSHEMETTLRNRSIDVIPAGENVDSLIRSARVVVTNGLSSVIREAGLYAKRTIILVDDRISLPDDRSNWWQAAELPNVEFKGSLKEVDFSEHSPKSENDISLSTSVSLDDVTGTIMKRISGRLGLQV